MSSRWTAPHQRLHARSPLPCYTGHTAPHPRLSTSLPRCDPVRACWPRSRLRGAGLPPWKWGRSPRPVAALLRTFAGRGERTRFPRTGEILESMNAVRRCEYLSDGRTLRLIRNSREVACRFTAASDSIGVTASRPARTCWMFARSPVIVSGVVKLRPELCF